MKFIDSSAKTNWKYIAIVVALGFLVVGISIVALRPKVEQRGKVEQVVYTKASWIKSFGAPSLNLFVANIDGSARRVVKEELPFDVKLFLLPEQKEALYIFQEMYFPYTIHIKKIKLETKKETTLATYKSQKGEGKKLYIPLLSPDKNKLALTIGKNLFVHNTRGEQSLEPQPLYTHNQGNPYATLSPEFWDSLGNIYLKSFNGYIKINSKGEKLPLPEEISFLQTQRSGGRVSDAHTTTVNDGGDNSIADDVLLIDNVAIDSIQGISKDIALSYGDAYKKSFEVLGFVRGVPLTGVEQSSQEKAIERQEADLQKFKQSALYPTYLPTGWKESNLPKAQTGQWNEQDALIGGIIYFRNSEGGLFFIQEQKTDARIPQGFIGVRDYISEYPKEFITSREDLIINGKSALYFTVSHTKQFVTWSSDGFDIAIVCFDSEGCSLEKEELIKIAHSMKPITTLQQSSRQAEPTAGWQTYRNEEFGFEVRIPGKWGAPRIERALPGASILWSFYDQTTKTLTMLDFVPGWARNTQYSTLEMVAGKTNVVAANSPYARYLNTPYVQQAIEEKVVDSHNAILVTSKFGPKPADFDGGFGIPHDGTSGDIGWFDSAEKGGVEKEVFIAFEGKFYRLAFLDSGDEVLFDQILSTFRFVEE